MKKTIHIKDKFKWGEEVFSLLSWFDADKVRNAKVMVVGAGALGNEVLKNLALFGIGNIFIVDYDTIEYSNLSRSVLFRKEDADNHRPKVDAASQRIKEINPDINVQTCNGNIGADVGLGVFCDMDVVIGCLDSRHARYLLNLHCFRANKIWIDGGIENLDGYVRAFKPGSSCYECGLTEEELANIYLKTGCPDIAKINASYGRVATTPVSASIIGAIQVQEALKVIHGLYAQSDEDVIRHKALEGRLFKYEGMNVNARLLKMKAYNDNCLSHELWAPAIKIDELGADTKIIDALKLIKDATNSNQLFINLRNNAFITKLIPDVKEEMEYEVMIPESKVSEFLTNNNIGLVANQRIFQEYIENIGDDFPYPNLTLNQVGIPYYDIIQVTTSRGISYIELSNDRNNHIT